MSINWVMLDPRQGFVRLPGEKPIYASPARTGLAITTPRTYPGNDPLSIHSKAGIVFLTNQRIVYLPAASSPQLQSFASPLTKLHDGHVSAPLFGPNVWQAVVEPVAGGGLPSTQAHIEISLTFKDGGAYDFHTNYERIRERFLQAIEAARDSDVAGTTSGSAVGAPPVNMDAVHLDELPTYQDSGRDELAPQPVPERGPPRRPPVQQEAPAPSFEEAVEGRVPEQRQSAAPPTDAPPGYEETQQQSIQQELEARLEKGS